MPNATQLASPNPSGFLCLDAIIYITYYPIVFLLKQSITGSILLNKYGTPVLHSETIELVVN